MPIKNIVIGINKVKILLVQAANSADENRNMPNPLFTTDDIVKSFFAKILPADEIDLRHQLQTAENTYQEHQNANPNKKYSCRSTLVTKQNARRILKKILTNDTEAIIENV